MLLTESEKAKAMELFWLEGERLGKKKGEKIGVKIGENRMGTLIFKLIDLGRIDDAQKACTDAKYRKILFKEFNL